MNNYINAKGKLIVIVGTSGTGKTTLLTKLKETYPSLRESVSYTTRTIRPGEIPGKSYFYISEAEFKEKIERGDFLEWAKVHNHLYGTERSFVEKELGVGRHLLFDLDVQGADSFKAHFGELAKVIFIAPPSLEAVSERLMKRSTESAEVVALRLANAKKELLRKYDYDYFLVNEEIEQACQELMDLVGNILKVDA